jgi:hypothetical protein
MSDLNGDGIEDLAVLNRLDATATVFYGEGDGTFQSGINLPAGSTPIGIAASDPDKNGFRAFLVADGSKLRWQQLAASSAQRVVQLDAGAAANGIAVGDFTGDGRSGVVIGAQGAVVWHPRDAGTAYYIRFSCPATASSGQSFNCFVGAYDQFNGAAVGFTDTVQFSSSDGSATLPGNTTIPTPADFNFTLVTPGTDTITAADITNDLPWPTIEGSIIVLPPPGDALLGISDIPGNGRICFHCYRDRFRQQQRHRHWLLGLRATYQQRRAGDRTALERDPHLRGGHLLRHSEDGWDSDRYRY